MKKMRNFKLIALMLVLAMSFAVVGCGGGNEPADTGDKEQGDANQEVITLHWGATSSPEHSYAKEADEFIKDVEEGTNGTVKIVKDFGGVLGGERQMTEAVMRGELDLEMTSDVGIAAVFPELGFPQLPFLFTGYDDIDTRYLDGWMGEYIAEELAKKGIVVLGWGENDYRALSNSKHPVKTPADLKGLKIRVPEIPMYIELFKELGTLPTPMAVTELPTALQQKTIDGQDNGAILTWSYGYYQFQPYMTKLNHIYSGSPFIISQKTWDKLSADQQKAMKEAAEAYVERQRATSRGDVAQFYKNMEENNVEVIDASDELVAFAREAGKKIWNDPEFEKLYGKEIMDKIKAEAE